MLFQFESPYLDPLPIVGSLQEKRRCASEFEGVLLKINDDVGEIMFRIFKFSVTMFTIALVCNCSSKLFLLQAVKDNEEQRALEYIGNTKSIGNLNSSDQRGNTPLHLATKKGQLRVLEALLSKGADSEATNNSGLMPAIYSFENKSVGDEALKLHISYGFDINSQFRDGRTFLLHHTLSGSDEELGLIVENGANVTSTDYLGRNILTYASVRGDTDIIKKVLEIAPELIHSKTDSGDTPLHYSSFRGHATAVNLLLNSGVDINDKNNLNENALFDACKGFHIEVAQALIKRGAVMDMKNAEGFYAFEYLFNYERKAEIDDDIEDIFTVFLDFGFEIPEEANDQNALARANLIKAYSNLQKEDTLGALKHFELSREHYLKESEVALELANSLEADVKRQENLQFAKGLLSATAAAAATFTSASLARSQAISTNQNNYYFSMYTYAPNFTNITSMSSLVEYTRAYSASCRLMVARCNNKINLLTKGE